MINETTLSKQPEQIESPVELAPLITSSSENPIPVPEPADTVLSETDSLKSESKPELEQEPKQELPITSPNPQIMPEPLPVFDFRQKTKEARQKKLEVRLGKIVDHVRQNGSITNDQIQKLLRVSDATASRYAKILITRNFLKKSGKTKSVKYELV